MKYQVLQNSQVLIETDNGRELCQQLFDLGLLPKQTRRPELTDKFNPVMMLQGASNEVEIIYNGNPLKTAMKTATPTPTPTAAPQGDAAQLLQQAIQQLVNNSAPALDEARVLTLINQALEKQAPRKVEFIVPDKQSIVIEDRMHPNFEKLVGYLQQGLHVMLVGEKGSGKTYAAKMAAKVLQRQFYTQQCANTSVKQDFLGFTDANGKASQTIFRKAFTEGGVFLLDEVDNGNANVGVALNAPLENRIAAFPDTMAEAHEHFICVGAMNTNGRGGTTQYAARNRQDEAFLDRFVFLEWNIDERFEMDIAQNKQWCKRIQQLRAKVKTLGIDFHIGTRATFQGEKIIAAGFNETDALASAVFKGLSQNQVDQILN